MDMLYILADFDMSSSWSGNICVILCRCCVLVSYVYPVVVINDVFCVV